VVVAAFGRRGRHGQNVEAKRRRANALYAAQDGTTRRAPHAGLQGDDTLGSDAGDGAEACHLLPAIAGRRRNKPNLKLFSSWLAPMNTILRCSSVECTELGDLLLVPIGLSIAVALATFYRSGFGNVDLEWPMIWITVSIWLISKAIPVFSVRIAIAALVQYVLIVFAATVMSYAAATAGRPLIDRELLVADQYIGYDWRAYAGFVGNHPSLAKAMKFSYAFIFFMPLIVTVALSATNNAQALEKFILAALISLLVTVGIFVLFPATTAWTHLQISDAEISAFHHLTLSSQDWIGKLIQIRRGDIANLQNLNGNGLIAFPSFHCTAALLFVWSTWTIRWLRVPMMAISLALLVATPIFGGHYISDMIAGAVVMVVSVGIARSLHAGMLDFKNAARAYWRNKPAPSAG
jgi:PAP2 superfamily